jgi:hypothetical protein
MRFLTHEEDDFRRSLAMVYLTLSHASMLREEGMIGKFERFDMDE